MHPKHVSDLCAVLEGNVSGANVPKHKKGKVLFVHKLRRLTRRGKLCILNMSNKKICSNCFQTQTQIQSGSRVCRKA